MPVAATTAAAGVMGFRGRDTSDLEAADQEARGAPTPEVDGPVSEARERIRVRNARFRAGRDGDLAKRAAARAQDNGPAARVGTSQYAEGVTQTMVDRRALLIRARWAEARGGRLEIDLEEGQRAEIQARAEPLRERGP